MVNYPVQYRMTFQDAKLLPWRIDLCLKDGPVLAEPINIVGSAVPLTIDRQNNDETKFAPIIQSQVTIQYTIRPDNLTDPAPETFILIESDTWLVNIYRNEIIYWKGFVNPGKKNYPWIPPPYSFSLVASDFSFAKSTAIDLNDPILFLYDYISLGDFFKRSLFHSVGYDDVKLNIIYSHQPGSIGADEIANGLYLHTDAFYDFSKGAITAYDAIEKIVKSMGARIFHDQGVYWLQFIEDIGNSAVNIIQITPDDIMGQIIPNEGTTAILGSVASDQIVYKDISQEIDIQQPLKSQLFDYNLKVINKIPNFDWRTDTQSPFDDWEGDITGFYQRVGTGSVQDPFRLHIDDFTSPGARSIWSRIPVQVNQRVSVTMKARSFLTLGSPASDNFEVFVNAIVMLVKAGTLGGLERKFLSPAGSWESFGDLDADSYYHISSRPNSDDVGTIEILSNPIPSLPGVTDYEILYIILDTGINIPPPGGSTYYSELYPVFMGIYNNPFIKYEETISTIARYSLTAEDDELFLIDTQDPAYSNNFYTKNDSGAHFPLPFKDWAGKNIDEIVVKQYADEQPAPAIAVMGSFYGNMLNFSQGVLLRDKAMLSTMQIRDKYNVRACTHDLMLTELFEAGAANANYIVRPLTKDD